ncbi:MAG: HAD family hydrolase [Actinobacteria bacterium HGW-Actinobacteria-2]|nr:MAG: HAD family hydrolase [Actinobacteria bacterium HGW-Actinobacteria-2]
MASPWSRPEQPYRGYLFDLDGTVYLGDELLPGARETLAELRRREIPVRFLSNNPTRDPQQYVAKLVGLGVAASVAEVINPVLTTVTWLKANHPEAVVFPIAEAPLRDAIRAAGLTISEDPAEIDIVIASYDRGFDYRKLQIAFDALWFHRRAFLVQTNPDRYCPFPGGRGEPDCAAITAAITASTGVECRHSFGKPDPIMLTTALATLPGLVAADVVMVGDRLHTDIAMGVAAGMDTALVLTGDTSAEQAAAATEYRPTYVLDRIDQLLPAAG